MEIHDDVVLCIAEYLSESDLRTMLLVSQGIKKKFEPVAFQYLTVTESNIGSILMNNVDVIRVKRLTLRGDFKNILQLVRLFIKINAKSFHVDSHFVFTCGLQIPESFLLGVEHLGIYEDFLEVIDLSLFPSLTLVSFLEFNELAKSMSSVTMHPNITKFSFVDCLFKLDTILEDYVYGDRAVIEDIVEIGAIKQFDEMIFENTTLSGGGITFELFNLIPSLYPNLRTLRLYNTQVSNLKSLSKFVNLRLLEMDNRYVNLEGVVCGSNLQYLNLKGVSIYLDEFVMDFKLKSLQLNCLSLSSKNGIQMMPECEYIQITTGRGKLCKNNNIWYHFEKKWCFIEEIDALGLLNK